MARPWRIQFEGAVYHVTSRGNHQQDIFLDDRDRRRFLELLERAIKRYRLEVLAFCLMGNHYHLFLRTAEANLAQVMHWLNGTYTGYFNWRHRTSGHLLQGRYKAILLADDTHYRQLSMYIHLNPVRAGMVKDPAQYPWSSFRDYISLNSRSQWLVRREILSLYGGKRLSCYRDYRQACLDLIGIKPAFVEQMKHNAVLGTRQQVEKLSKTHRPSGKAATVPDYSAANRKEIDAERELDKVAKLFRVAKADLKIKHTNFPAKLAAYFHLAENCGMSITKVAEALRVGSSAVSMGIKCLKASCKKDRGLKRKLESLTEN